MNGMSRRVIECPACGGDGGVVVESYSGFDSYYGPEMREDWRICLACGGEGTLTELRPASGVALAGAKRAADHLVAAA